MDRERAIKHLAAGIEAAVDSSGKGPGELSRLLHVNERTLRRYRRGERVPPRAWLRNLESCCGVEPGTLVALLDAIPDEPQAAGKAAGQAPDAPEGASQRLATRRRALLVATPVVVAAIVAAILLATGGSGRHRLPAQVGSGPGSRASSARGRTGPAGGGKRILEWADNHLGSPVFSNATGAAVVGAPARIPFGTKVFVTCEIPNDSSGMTSVTAFYRVDGGQWSGDYVVSDTMSNGGPPGNTDTPDVDSRVPRCSQ